MAPASSTVVAYRPFATTAGEWAGDHTGAGILADCIQTMRAEGAHPSTRSWPWQSDALHENNNRRPAEQHLLFRIVNCTELPSCVFIVKFSKTGKLILF